MNDFREVDYLLVKLNEKELFNGCCTSLHTKVVTKLRNIYT